jgi:hypothetical protein
MEDSEHDIVEMPVELEQLRDESAEVGSTPIDDSDLDVDISYHGWKRWRQRAPDWSVDIKTAYQHSVPVFELKMESFRTEAGIPDRVHLFGEHDGRRSYLMVMYVSDDVLTTSINLDGLFVISGPARSYLRALGDQQGYTLPRSQRNIDQSLANP